MMHVKETRKVIQLAIWIGTSAKELRTCAVLKWRGLLEVEHGPQGSDLELLHLGIKLGLDLLCFGNYSVELLRGSS